MELEININMKMELELALASWTRMRCDEEVSISGWGSKGNGPEHKYLSPTKHPPSSHSHSPSQTQIRSTERMQDGEAMLCKQKIKQGGERRAREKESKIESSSITFRPYRTIHCYNDDGNQTQYENQLKPTSFTMLNWQQNIKVIQDIMFKSTNPQQATNYNPQR